MSTKLNLKVSNVLNAGSVLNEAQILKSENGNFFLTLEHRGNLVVYKGRPFARQNSLWSSQTNKANNPHPYTLKLNLNGDLVMYDAKNGKVWASNTQKKNGKDFRLIIENDGNLVIRDLDNECIWQTKNNTIQN